MSLRYTIEKEDSLIRVRTEGLFDFLKAYEMWEQIAAACTKYDCYHVLGFSNLDEPFPEMDAYEHLGILESVGISEKHRVAWVATKPELLDNLRLAEMVIRHRSSIEMKAFDREKDARRWLRAAG